MDLTRLIVALDRRPRRRMVAGSVGSADEIPCYFLFTWHRSGDPMSCWPTIPIHIICRWCIIRKFTYDVKKAFDGIYAYQSVTKNDISSHTCTPVWFLKQPIAKFFFGSPHFKTWRTVCEWECGWTNGFWGSPTATEPWNYGLDIAKSSPNGLN